MGLGQIGKLMAFRQRSSHVLSMAEWDAIYKLRPVGTLTYYGIVDQNVDYFRLTGRALQPKHRAVIDDLLTAIYSGYSTELTIQIVLEPIQNPDRYDYILQHLDLVGSLAMELSLYCEEAEQLGKSLSVIVRFGSEMNDVDGTAGTTNPADFIGAYRAVRGIFAKGLPRARFPFSPALRADLEIERIAAYWPGKDSVDLLGATWYVHGENQQQVAFSKMREYFQTCLRHDLPLSLDEFGGAEGVGDLYIDNDCMLRKMFAHIGSLNADGIHFAYGTVFLDEHKYGIDATLRFLTHSQGEPV